MAHAARDLAAFMSKHNLLHWQVDLKKRRPGQIDLQVTMVSYHDQWV